MTLTIDEVGDDDFQAYDFEVTNQFGAGRTTITLSRKYSVMPNLKQCSSNIHPAFDYIQRFTITL